MVENEENVSEMEENSTESNVTDDQTETTDQKDETSPSAEPGADEKTSSDQQAVPGVDFEAILKELKPKYTNDFIETDNFKLQVDHYMTTGDMLVSMLLAANIAVMLLCRLLRDRK